MPRRPRSIPLDPERLALFLSQEESDTLEFKREWYKLESASKAAKLQKDELVKDILALANGNAEVVGETSILVVGAEDHRSLDGSRKVRDLGEALPTAVQILDIVRAAASPPLAYIEVVPFQVGDARLFAVVIPPSPHIHETTRSLQTSSQTYSKYVVFIRKGAAVDIASEREREVLRRLKRVLLAEATNPPATMFGATVGATIAAYLLGKMGPKITGSKEGTIAGGAVGLIFGGIFGALIGSSYRLVRETGREFYRAPLPRRRLAIAASVPVALATWFASQRLADRLTRRDRGRRQLRPPGA